ncbi:MAG: lipid A deacylase LpxR family protein [Candidatus Aminicenantes bacterium]|nr:lipid A deacylase LpxR family protein [Candidatus Aminicenantes bacterium]
MKHKAVLFLFRVKKHTLGVLFFLFLLGLNGQLIAVHLDEYPSRAKGKGSFVFNLENDVWFTQDEGYTNGIGFSWISPELDKKSKSPFIRFLYCLNLRFLGSEEREEVGSGPGSACRRWGVFSLAQGMFTPADLTRKEIIPYDRPYAGLLYAGLTLVKSTGRSQDSLGLASGLVGPHSYAGALQRWLHKTYGWTYPQGWENQLKDEPILEIWFNRFWTLVARRKAASGWSPAVKAGVGGELGNLMTAVEAVLDLRFGFNLHPEADSFSWAPLFGQLDLAEATRTSVYAFLRFEGKVVARNLLLEGSTFADGHGVELNHFYGQLISGLVYRSAEATLSFYWVLRTKEFKGQRYFDPYCGLTFGFNL